MDNFENCFSAAEKIQAGKRIPLYMKFWYIIRHVHVPLLLDGHFFDVTFWRKTLREEKKWSKHHIRQFYVFFEQFVSQWNEMIRLGFEVRWADRDRDHLGVFAYQDVEINMAKIDFFLSAGMKPEVEVPWFNSLVEAMAGQIKMLLGVASFINQELTSPLVLQQIKTPRRKMAKEMLDALQDEHARGGRHVSLHCLGYEDSERDPILIMKANDELKINYKSD